MAKIFAAFALINTISGQHLVIHRKDENTYGLPGGKITECEQPTEALAREIYETTGLKFNKEDFRLLFIEEKNQDGKDFRVHAYACTKVISDASPVKSFDRNIRAIFMDPRVFYTMTKFKKFYNHIFE